MSDNKFFITTPIFYANAKLHIGHSYTLVLADILARYHRAQGEQTFFLTGADEHGDKILRVAQTAGMSPQAFVDQTTAEFKELMSILKISNDLFIRTSDSINHWPGALKLWQGLVAAGDVRKGIYQGLYCIGCEAFITEKDLADGKCPLHDAVPERIEEENYFFSLAKYGPELKRLIEQGTLKITPASKAHEMLGLLAVSEKDGGLGDISISRPERDIPWGIPVPEDPSQLMYVWCDALANYLSALGYGQENDEKFRIFWPPDIQVVGKDIMRFHVLLWPALLLSAKLPLPREILAHGFITSGGRKMSKTIGNVLKAEDFISEYGVEALRYYFAREIVPTDDGDLTSDRFKEVYNANLANGLGNLVSRTLKMTQQYFSGRVTGDTIGNPPFRGNIAPVTGFDVVGGINVPYVVINDILPRYHAHMRAHEVNKAADIVWELIGKLDQYITDYEPFKLVKTDPRTTELVLWGVVYGLSHITEMIAPLMPGTAEILRQLIKQEVSGDAGENIIFVTDPLPKPLFMRKK